jgi:hypothetical protein
MVGKGGRPAGATKKKQWDETDVLLQHLYGLSLFNPDEAKPKFGAGVKLDLAVGNFTTKIETTSKGKTIVSREGSAMESLPPTLFNVAWHMGYMRWILDGIANLIRKSNFRIQDSDLDRRFVRGGVERSVREFEMQRVGPLRKALLDQQYPLYLYCVPSVVNETDLTSGKPLMTEGERVLCVLPKSLAVALHYGLSEPEIQLLARQVIWLVKLLCSVRVIRTPDQLIDALDDWTGYLSSGVMEHVRAAIQENNPQLISERSSQKFIA